ncbi:rhomboid family intramembrane serine protease [Pseudomonas typographi]|uniref:Rhomboid family intramembrane serine protease n=1 Tax=Pseudomonas typographi TaxID=2715964 RepID=A0ABR7Z9J9_9PSED|nr:rhomboid family intramembrane serine protease [Pseudomonas typographi]MBD1552306.1 rhomboid family intramembrane serine protease [Pseudomonas typographi]MBD1587426.1 rhomboid family intramembrane serine protease [Pseudomonas typographi]MBD1601933.1 rhomboid family intramembrane serine protease [Pseudomonas typographi]
MSAVVVLRLPLVVDLSAFIGVLRRLRVPHRVSEEGGEQVLWARNEREAEDIRHLYERYAQGEVDSAALGFEPPAHSRPGWQQQLKASPVTTGILLLCLVVGALSLLGEHLEPLHWLTFLDFRVQGDLAYFRPWASSMAAGQVWRLVTPMFIHFGILHLAMNSLWFWELGRRIEWRQGSWALLGLSLGFSAVSNVIQYLWSGPSLFGGLSGVLYGLLGHIWLYQWRAPTPLYHMPRGVLVMMLAWLGLCLSGFVSLLGFGEIANGAHVGGLLVGCATGLLGGTLARRKLG